MLVSQAPTPAVTGPRRSPAVFSYGLAVLGLCACVLTSTRVLRPAMFAAHHFPATHVIGNTFPKQLVDPLGTSHTLLVPPQRILSTMLAGDEMLAALVPVERLAAVTPLIDMPGMSNSVGAIPPSVPRLQGATEAIIALQPDLVLTAGYNRAEMVRLLTSAGIPLLRFSAYNSFADVLSNLRMLGAAVGAEERAAALMASVQQRITAVEMRVQGRPRPRVLYYAAGGYTAGAETLIDEMITRAGGSNVAREAQYTGTPALPLEAVLRLTPDVIIVPDWQEVPQEDVARRYLRDPLWQHIPAVQQGRVYAIQGAWLSTVSQHAIRGLEEMARRFHPGAFS